MRGRWAGLQPVCVCEKRIASRGFPGDCTERKSTNSLRNFAGIIRTHRVAIKAGHGHSTLPEQRALLSATMTGTGGGPSIKTDRAVYPEPPLAEPSLAGAKYVDPVFGTQIMRATDGADYPAPGCGDMVLKLADF